MKKQYLIDMLILAMILALLLCGCTAAVFDTASEGADLRAPARSDLTETDVSAGDAPTGPDFPGQSAPDQSVPDQSALSGSDSPVSAGPSGAAQVGKDVDRIDYGVGDSPAAPEETQYGRALDGQELQALWARLEGKWILSDSQAWKQAEGLARPVYYFSAGEYGDCRLWEYSAFGSGIYEWIFTGAWERNGVYTFRAISESSAPQRYNCYQNSGTLFTLQFTEDGISLALSRPTRFQWPEDLPTEDMNAPTATRPATEEECALLAQYGDEYGQLKVIDAGFQIVAGYERPAQMYRLVTDEELERLMQEIDG